MAGGTGSRLGGEKQFRPLGGRPLMCWSASVLLQVLDGPLVVVLPMERMDEGEALLHAHFDGYRNRLRVAPGGPTRQDSTRAGLAALFGMETVLVHDASRPFVSPRLVARIAEVAARGRAVIPALRIDDTLKEVAHQSVVCTHDRERFVKAQTPQGFPLDLLRQAHEQAADQEATDDAALCEAAGIPVTWIEGDHFNRKLTHPVDWAWAEAEITAGRIQCG